MRKQSPKSKVASRYLVATLVFCAEWIVAPAHAQDKVVVIPLMENAGGSPAPVPKTGQTTSYDTGDDGDLEKGVPAPTPRFTDNGNGTVTDHLTGLIWLKDGNCTKFYASDPATGNARPWVEAVASANRLSSSYCGLTDGSKAGDWRLPNLNELNSLIDRGQFLPALPPGCPLRDSTGSYEYWSSTTSAITPPYGVEAWHVNFFNGNCRYATKADSRNINAVQGGQ